MARITSKAALIEYIKTTLGHPIVRVDVTEQQISQIIDNSIQKFTEYAWGTLEESVLVQINGRGEYPMPDTMTNLLKLSQGSTSNLTNFSANFGAGYVPDLWSSQFFSGSLTGDIIPAIIGISTTKAVLDKFFGDDIVYNFNPHKKILQVLENYVGPAVLHYQYEYIADDNNDMIFNHEWIKEHTVAKVRYQWGNNTGKLDQTLIGGARINYADMKSEATTELERLDELLLSKFSDPAPIFIG
jgi:hypothetical protein